MNAAQAAAAAEEAQLSVEQSKLPLFHAEPGKDQYTWTNGWNDSKNADKPATGTRLAPRATSTTP